MRQTTAVGICCQQSREEGGEEVEWVWLCVGCVSPTIQERLAVVWMVFYSCLFKCVCGVAMWVLCVKCGMGCGLLVAMTENW